MAPEDQIRTFFDRYCLVEYSKNIVESYCVFSFVVLLLLLFLGWECVGFSSFDACWTLVGKKQPSEQGGSAHRVCLRLLALCFAVL